MELNCVDFVYQSSAKCVYVCVCVCDSPKPLKHNTHTLKYKITE